MMAAERAETWLDDLPAVQGRYEIGADLSRLTWFRVGGPVDVLFRPADEADLRNFLRNRPAGVPLTVIGVGSNLLVRDGGVEGIVIRLGRGFAHIEIDECTLTAGASAPDVNVALAAARAGIAGLEFLRGIPGTIGGALRMNGGAYGREISDVFVSARAVDFTGDRHEAGPEDMGFGYRKSAAPADWIFTAAALRGVPGDREAIMARMTEVSDARLESQPVRMRTGGSTFKNPRPDDCDGRRAWELIDAAGCRGLTCGDAQVSEQHCNFLINRGNATAADLEALGETVRRRVKEATGVSLEWEIRIIGRKDEDSPAKGGAA